MAVLLESGRAEGKVMKVAGHKRDCSGLFLGERAEERLEVMLKILQKCIWSNLEGYFS